MNDNQTISYGDLAQLQLSYNIVEDRISIIFYSTNKQQITVWLTRRLLVKAIPSLDNVFSQDQLATIDLNSSDDIVTKNSVEKKIALSESATQQLQFIGENENCTVTTMTVDITNETNLTFKFFDQNDCGLIVYLSSKIAYSLYAVLQKTIEKADWNL